MPLARRALLAVFGLTVGLVSGSSESPVPAVTIQTDSLRAEAARLAGPRVTVVRRLATRIDSILAVWVPDTVVRTDTVRVAQDSAHRALVRALARRIDSLESVVSTAPPPVDTIPPPPVDTTPPPPVDTTSPPSGAAELPRDSVAAPPSTTWPCTLTVPATGNVQTALDAARGGDVLCLTTGATYTGSYLLPARPDSGWVVIRPNVHDSLFALPGERLRPTRALAARLPIIRTVDRAFKALPGSRGWHILGLDIQSNEQAVLRTFSLIELGENILGVQPTHIALDRLWLHPTTPSAMIRRAVNFNGGWLSLTDSWCEDIHETGQDSQCIIGFNGTGPYRFENNFLSASSEIFMMGGGDPANTNLVAADVTIRRNHFQRPVAWKGDASRAPIKTTIETKSVLRLLIEGNVLEGNWQAAHYGEAIQLKSADQGGRCHLCRTSDVTIRRNYIKNHGTGLYLVGKDNSGSATSRTDSVLRRIVFSENWVDSTNVSPYTGRAMQAMFIAGVEDVDIHRNVWTGGSNMNSYLSFTKDGTFGLISVARLNWSGNVVQPGQYGVVGCPTAPAWTNCASSVTFGLTGIVGSIANVVVVPGASQYPTLTSALDAGLGVSWTVIQSATAGVVVTR